MSTPPTPPPNRRHARLVWLLLAVVLLSFALTLWRQLRLS